MGANASHARQEILQQDKEKAKETADQIAVLQELGRNVIEKFQARVRAEKDPLQYGIGKIVTERSSILLVTKTHQEETKNNVKKIVDHIAEGEIGDLITTIVCQGIDAMVASASGSVAEKKLYAVKLDGISVERIDVYLYQYEVEVQGVETNYQKLFVYTYFISTIENVTRKMLRSLISLSLPETEDKREKALQIFESLERVIDTEENLDGEKKRKKARFSEEQN